jgi:hypothetical protein
MLTWWQHLVEARSSHLDGENEGKSISFRSRRQRLKRKGDAHSRGPDSVVELFLVEGMRRETVQGDVAQVLEGNEKGVATTKDKNVDRVAAERNKGQLAQSTKER